MNWVDLLIILVLVLGALKGLRQGFVVEVATILGFVLALIVARLGYTYVRPLVSFLPTPQWRTAIAYLIVVAIVVAVVNAGARVARFGLRALFLGLLDRLAGALVGLLESALVVELLLYLARRLPNHNIRSGISHSRLAPSFVQVIPLIHRLFPHVPHY